jgi:hypothetical protein
MENLPARPRLNSQPTQTGKDITNKLFGSLKIQYPNFMKNQDEALSKRMWHSQLDGFLVEHIEAAAVLCPDRYPSFAPTIGEFKALVREVNKPDPAKAITMDDICQNCRSSRDTQRHEDICINPQ